VRSIPTGTKAGLLETQTYPGGRQARTCYNNSGQEISQTGVSSTPNRTYATGATYASHGALASATIGPGAVSMVYNPSHRQLIQSKVNGYWQMDLSYCPNGVSPCATNNGNIRQIVLNDTMATRTQNFSYDSANRLQTAAETNGFAQTYGYDQYSNRWITPTSSLPGGNFQPTSAAWFDAATNRLHSAVGNTYFHDAAGNMIVEASTTFAYDAEGRMIRSTIPYATGTVITQYFYDGEGRRVKKQNQALGKTLYVYDAFGKLAVEFPEQALAPCATCYLFTDQVNTTRLVLDQGGTVMKRADHMPFGEEILNGAPWANGRGSLYADNNPVRQQFTGYLRNEPYEWALDFANARYYRRSIGRFTSPDSTAYSKMSNPQSWNLYAYTFNNPLANIDPTGNEVQAANCSTEAECQKTLSAVQGALANQQAAARVGIAKIQRGFWGRIGAAISGAPQFRFTISGDMASFKGLGQNASRFGQLVENKTVVTAAVADRYTSFGGAQRQTPGGFAALPSQGLDAAATVANHPTPFDTDASPGANVSETMAHELLGHAWGEIVANHPAGTFQNMRDSVQAENAVRATDPSRGQKLQHHGNPNPVVVYSPQEIQRMRKK
jgi:RHS repeat-associated protein